MEEAEPDTVNRNQEADSSALQSPIIWIPDFIERIARFLPYNDVACGLRLVNKATAFLFHNHCIIKLSLPSPNFAFAARWGAPGALRSYPFKARMGLLCLTASSGSIPNLDVALKATGCKLSERVFSAAASAGQLDMCNRLLQLGCPWSKAVLADAANAGQQAVCEWLLDQGCHWHRDAVLAAARAGHPGLMQCLLARQPSQEQGFGASSSGAGELVAAAAEGCALEVVQRLHQDWMEVKEGRGLGLGRLQTGTSGLRLLSPPALQQSPHHRQVALRYLKESIIAAAAGSPTPDWRAKVIWLNELGYPRTPAAYPAAVALPDAVERLVWLRQRGFPPIQADAVSVAARTGNAAAVSYMLAEVPPPQEPLCVPAAAAMAALRGHLDVLQLLHARKWPMGQRVMQYAADAGHLSVIMWAVKVLRMDVAKLEALVPAAAASGSLVLLQWLHDRGCSLTRAAGATAVQHAVKGGCEEALEWLVKMGCPLSAGLEQTSDGSLYRVPALRGDLAMLRCLDRLGCPMGAPEPLLEEVASRGDLAILACLQELRPAWRPTAGTFTTWLIRGYPLASLRWLLDGANCPMDWEVAVEVAEQLRRQPRRGGGAWCGGGGVVGEEREKDAAEWLREEQQRRQRRHGGQQQ